MFIIKKKIEKVPALKSNSTFKIFFLRMNNKKFMKMGPQGAPLLFLYEVSIAILIDFIAVLLTPGIF